MLSDLQNKRWLDTPLLLQPDVAAAAAFATGLSLLLLQVYIPELQAAAEEAEGEDPETAWRQFGETVMARQPPEPQQQNTGRGQSPVRTNSWSRGW